jgi:hypothetical protein
MRIPEDYQPLDQSRNSLRIVQLTDGLFHTEALRE